jgi:D-alanine--poly(phosphoribitol) ligase subunit 1
MIGDLIPSGFRASLDPEGMVDAKSVRHLADAVARTLAAEGAQQGGVVAVEGADPFGWLVGMLAAWRNGCAVVPIHPSVPLARADYMRRTGRVTHRLRTPADRLEAASYAVKKIGSIVDDLPDDLAYILFTSGSTGDPKGVLVGHRAVERRLTGLATYADISESAEIASLTNPMFDISLAEVLLPLIVGCGLATPLASALRRPSELKHWLQGSGATLIQGTPTLFQLLQAAQWSPTATQTIWSAGEALPGPLAAWAARHAADVWNLYGPTEAVIYATAWHYSAPAEWAVMPIGQWLPGSHGELLPHDGLDDNYRRLREDHEIGELAIGGDITAIGYVRGDGISPLRFATVGAEKLYATGDLCSRDRAGTLHYLGRLDDQVKVRGYRIELGDVESAALRCSRIMRCAAFAMASGGLAAGKLAIAVVGTNVDVAAFRNELAVWLPEYMIPSAVFVRDDLPVTATGKTDRSKVAAELGGVKAHTGGQNVLPGDRIKHTIRNNQGLDESSLSD